jgi:HD-GYP domain-containing protein (c-di-GMP phosphodiesterase class II)
MTLEDSLSSQSYKNMLAQVKEFCKACLPYSHIYGYRNHGYRHAEDVIAILEKLLECYRQYRDTLSEEEICILLTSCYLHDIGMIVRNDVDDYEEMRRLHNENGHSYIDQYWVQMGIDPRCRQVIMDTCYAHSDFFNEKGVLVNTLENDLPEYPSIAPGSRSLAALVRVANMFALQVDSSAHIPQTIFFQKDTPEKDEWFIRQRITRVNFSSSGEAYIEVDWSAGTNATILDVYRAKLLFSDLIKDLRKRLQKSRKYLPNQINLNRVSSNLDGYQQSLNGKQRDVVSLAAESIRIGETWLVDKKGDAWGKLKVSRPRVATTAKTIIGLLDHSRARDIDYYKTTGQITDAFQWIMHQHDSSKGGFPAKTLESYSKSALHCTAMAIYVYALLCEKAFLIHGGNSVEAQKMGQAVEWLLEAKQPKGWGNWEGQPVRPLCTYWALRAIKRVSRFMPLKRPVDFRGELDALFEFAGPHNVAVCCFCLVLAQELEDEIKAEDLKELRQKALDWLFDARLEHGLWHDEIEEYSIRGENNEQLLSPSWIHHISALAVHALAANRDYLQIDQMEKLSESILALMNNQKLDGGFDFVPPSTSNRVTPTYESLNSLNKVLEYF